MALRPAQTTFDAVDAQRLGTFWAEALGWTLDAGASEVFASLGLRSPGPYGQTYLFLQVPEPKTAKNRMHLDFEVDDVAAEVERLAELGATRVEDHREHGVRWTQLRDVEGNEFCVVQAEVIPDAEDRRRKSPSGDR